MKKNNSKYQLNVHPANSALQDFAHINNFRPESSAHHPATKVTLNWNPHTVSGIFLVQDQYVKCVHTKCGDPVCKDSCVEFFVKPNQGAGYFNFEFNAQGTALASYVTNPLRTPEGKLQKSQPFTDNDYKKLTVQSSLQIPVNTEISEPTNWELKFAVPVTLLEKYTGPLKLAPLVVWEANFYKCADDCSHPHWGSWTQLPEKNFHRPDCFGKIIFK